MVIAMKKKPTIARKGGPPKRKPIRRTGSQGKVKKRATPIMGIIKSLKKRTAPIIIKK
tara:strand:+ start:1847 stop:2020 length:174 start_codon:yes stop_codon:yes gene_type:complete